MASSPEPPVAPDGVATAGVPTAAGPTEGVRWPWMARVGVALAVLTLVGGLAAAFIAAFVIDRSDDPEPAVEGLGAAVDDDRTGVRYWFDDPVGDAQSPR